MDNFLTIVSAVLMANLLTVALVYAIVTIERREQIGDRKTGFMSGIVVLVIGMLLAGIYASGSMDWLVAKFSSRFG